MKNNSRIALLLLIVISFSMMVGCTKEEPTIITGTIMEVDANKILVSQKSDIKSEDLNKSLEQLIREEDFDLIWVDTGESNHNLEKGDQVEVMIQGDVKESYPSQAKAKEIKVTDKLLPKAEEIESHALKYKTFKELPESLKEPIGYIKKLRGFGIVKRNEDETIIYIGSGQKPTGGYNITVESVRQIEGITKIEVFEKGPGPDESVTQAITYPYVVIKVFKSVSNIEVINNQGDKFKDINDESSEADYFERKQ